jgi:hypothetical protein
VTNITFNLLWKWKPESGTIETKVVARWQSMVYEKRIACINSSTFSFSTFVEVNEFSIVLSDGNWEYTNKMQDAHFHLYFS